MQRVPGVWRWEHTLGLAKNKYAKPSEKYISLIENELGWDLSTSKIRASLNYSEILRKIIDKDDLQNKDIPHLLSALFRDARAENLELMLKVLSQPSLPFPKFAGNASLRFSEDEIIASQLIEAFIQRKKTEKSTKLNSKELYFLNGFQWQLLETSEEQFYSFLEINDEKDEIWRLLPKFSQFGDDGLLRVEKYLAEVRTRFPAFSVGRKFRTASLSYFCSLANKLDRDVKPDFERALLSYISKNEINDTFRLIKTMRVLGYKKSEVWSYVKYDYSQRSGKYGTYESFEAVYGSGQKAKCLQYKWK